MEVAPNSHNECRHATLNTPSSQDRLQAQLVVISAKKLAWASNLRKTGLTRFGCSRLLDPLRAWQEVSVERQEVSQQTNMTSRGRLNLQRVKTARFATCGTHLPALKEPRTGNSEKVHLTSNRHSPIQ